MEQEYLSVSEINNYIKTKLTSDSFLQNIFLKGEISNFKNHTSGHLYFSIKDENSRINAIMFKNNALKLNFKPIEGSKVLVVGSINVFHAAGSYQITVEEMIEDGVGNLYIAFEKLKKQLHEEGLFDPEKKKKIPRLPQKIGIITAATGAAIKDILSTIKRRYPLAQTILFPSLVQGEKAKDDIVKNLKLADTYDLDVIILGRGGGSIEDLWPFNEEIVARQIFKTKTPIISAVGHEVDFTISDFVADLRAPTPTGAAEMAVPELSEIIKYLNQVQIRLKQGIKNQLEISAKQLLNIKNSYFFKNPEALFEQRIQKIDFLHTHLLNNYQNILKEKNNKYQNLNDKLLALNPKSILKRGYAIVKNEEDKVIKLKNININDNIKIEMIDGIIQSNVTNIKEQKNEEK